VGRRELGLELAYAEAKGIPLLHIHLRTDPPVPIWDFSHPEMLIEEGYRITKENLKEVDVSVRQ